MMHGPTNIRIKIRLCVRYIKYSSYLQVNTIYLGIRNPLIFICTAYFTKLTAIRPISLNKINRFDCVTDAVCVLLLGRD